MGTHSICTCSETQLYLVGCDCVASYDNLPLSIVPPNPARASRRARREDVCAAARRDAEDNIDNRAAYAGSSSDWYAYIAEWDWRCRMIDLETSAA